MMPRILALVAVMLHISLTATALADNRLETLACETNLITMDDQRREAISLLIDTYPNMRVFQRFSQQEKQQHILRQTRIKACLTQQIEHFIQAYKVSDRQSLTQTSHRIFHDLQWLAGHSMHAIPQKLSSLDPAHLFTQDFIPTIQYMHHPIAYEHAVTALIAYPDILPVLQQIESYIHDELRPDQLYDQMMVMAAYIPAIPDQKAQEWASLTLMRIMGRNLYHTTTRGQEAFEKRLKSQGQPIPTYTVHTPKRIADDIADTLDTNGVANAHGMIKQAYEQARKESTQHFTLRGYTLQEGDIVMDSTANGFGQFFQSIIQTPSMYGHMAVITAEAMDGWHVYYRAEIQNNLQYGPISDYLKNSIMARPSHNLPVFFTDKALRHIEHAPPKFDASFNPAIAGTTTHISLYCAELTHHLYATGYGLWRGNSPFPAGAEPLAYTTPVFLDNMAFVDVKGDGGFLLPDRIIQNPNNVILGITTKADDTMHPQRSYLRDQLTLDYYEHILRYTAQAPFVDLGLLEMAKLYIILQIAQATQGVELHLIDFADRKRQLFFFKIFMALNDLETLTDPSLTPAADLPMTEADSSKKKEHFYQTLLPELAYFFKFDT